MVPISNYDVYDSRMRKSLIDKAFFLDKIDVDVFVDFGCADGALLGMISSIFPEYTYIGYDNDPKMVQAAYATMYRYNRDNDIDYMFHFDWDKIADRVASEKVQGKRVALILSSLLHEVYDYCSVSEIDEFWERVNRTGFDCIVVRDMSFDAFPDDPPPKNWVTAVREGAVSMNILARLGEFEARWGNIGEDIRTFTHFLMKYRYGENWKRELEEDYSPITVDGVIDGFEPGWNVTHFERFALPFNVRQIRKDFGFDFELKTHYKLILERS